jgi:hypothetical protein
MPAASMRLALTVFSAALGAQPRPQRGANGVGSGDGAEARAVEVTGVGSGVGSGGGSIIGRRSYELIE